ADAASVAATAVSAAGACKRRFHFARSAPLVAGFPFVASKSGIVAAVSGAEGENQYCGENTSPSASFTASRTWAAKRTTRENATRRCGLRGRGTVTKSKAS